MSEWHRENPDLMFTDADPWMVHASYRAHAPAERPDPSARDLEDPDEPETA